MTNKWPKHFLGLNGPLRSEQSTTSSYFLDKRCTGGSKIMTTEKCKAACSELEIKLTNARNFKNGKPCFRGRNGKCSQNGRNGKQATLVCANKGDLFPKKMSRY